MSLFFALIILLLVWFFVIAPFIRLIRVSRQWQNTFKQAQQQQHKQRRSPEATPQPKKKIDPTVGEYVEFTETTITREQSDSDGNTTTSRTVEQQITDVSWEDLPSDK